MKANIAKIKELREATSAGYTDCKKALVKCNYDVEEAKKILRVKGYTPKGDRETAHGIIYSYIHPGNRIGSMVELKCESDFVAKTSEVKEFAKQIAMQVAAMNPWHISRKEVGTQRAELERWKRVNRLERENKDFDLIDDIADAEMARWYSEICLLEQPYIKNNSMAVKDLLSELVNKVKENCKITKVTRWEIGLDERSQEMIRAGWDKVGNHDGSWTHSEPKMRSEKYREEHQREIMLKKYRTPATILLWFMFLVTLFGSCAAVISMVTK